MSSETTVETLENALFERARKLADEYLARARQTRERMIEEENERLRLREERETLAAEAEAERLYRRRVQAVELQVQGDLDRLRWELVGRTKEAMMQRFADFTQGPEYPPVLRRLLAEALAAIGDGDLVVQVNAADRERLATDWEGQIGAVAPGVHAVLDEQTGSFLGGVLVRTADDTVRVDNTFEGRMDRFEDRINQAIAEALFAAGMAMEGGAHG